MKLKPLSILIALFVFSFTTQAQFWFMHANNVRLRESDTTYIAVDKLPLDKNTLNIIKQGWNLSKIRVIGSNMATKKVPANYGLLEFDNTRYIYTDGGSFQTDYICFYYKGQRACRIYIYTPSGNCSAPSFENINSYGYDWGLGFLKNYLQVFCECIRARRHLRPLQRYTNYSELKRLQNDTLYFANYMFNYPLGYLNSAQKQIRAADVMSAYNYKYKILPAEKINKMILDTSRSTLYVITWQCFSRNGAGYDSMAIIDSKTGTLVFTDSKSHWDAIAPKDIKKLNKYIGKAK